MKIAAIILLLFISCLSQAQTVNDLRPTVTMKEYVDMQAELNRKMADAQFENIKDNVEKATGTLDKRLDGMNEFRDTLKDQASTFITRAELFGWIMALLMAGIAVANYRRGSLAKSEGKAIVSGDKVEVKK